MSYLPLSVFEIATLSKASTQPSKQLLSNVSQLVLLYTCIYLPLQNVFRPCQNLTSLSKSSSKLGVRYIFYTHSIRIAFHKGSINMLLLISTLNMHQALANVYMVMSSSVCFF